MTALVAVPWLLGALGGAPIPGHVPTGAQITDALTRPDDGTLFLTVLLLAGWVGWAAFTLSAVVEITAQVRGRAAPRLPALGVSQRAASTLVAAVIALLVPAPTLAITAHPVAAAPVAHESGTHPTVSAAVQQTPGQPGHASRVGSPRPDSAARDRVAAGQPTYEVQRQDTLWSIAERCLGAGERFTEIAALNYGTIQPDGHALTNSHWIFPGWRLLLPPDARSDNPAELRARHASSDPTPARTPSSGIHEASYTVAPGDTLWDIAETQLGSPERYLDVADLNTGVRQPDGDHLVDPDHIEPGWRLALPAQAETEAQGRDTGGHDTASHHGSGSSHSRRPPPATPEDHEQKERVQEQAANGAVQRGADPVGANGRHHTPSPGATDPTETVDSSPDFDPVRVGLGLGAVTVAALLAELARRRVLQQRARMPGRRIALPDPATRAVETQLRATGHGGSLDLLRAALLLLAAGCRAAGRDLPAVAAVRIASNRIELDLLHPDPDPVEPFTATSASNWRVGLHDTRLHRLRPAEAVDPFPYPALLTVNVGRDSMMLIDLEAAGSLTLIAAPEVAAPVLNAWALELAAAPVWTTVGVTLVGTGWPDAARDATRVRLLDSPETAIRRAQIRTRDVLAVLDAAGVATVRQARSRDVAADVWDPEVILTGPDAGPKNTVPDLLEAAGPGLLVVTAASAGFASQSGWTLTLSSTEPHTGRLEPLGIDVTPPRFHATDLAAVTAALTISADHTAVARDPATVTKPAAEPPEDVEPSGDDLATRAPTVLVLGPVEVRFAGGEDAGSARRRKLTELAAFIALHPGADNHGIDDAIWTTRRVSTATRNSATSRLRRWLGTDPDDEPWLPAVPDRGHYRFRPGVTCDWNQFQTLAAEGLASGPDGFEHLSAALDLVRGRPFSGVDPAAYTWAEYDTQEMISAITDVAHALSAARLATGDAHGARTAAARGLLVESCSEILTQDAIRAAVALGDDDEASRILARLRARLLAVDPDAEVEPDTAALVGIGAWRVDPQ